MVSFFLAFVIFFLLVDDDLQMNTLMMIKLKLKQDKDFKSRTEGTLSFYIHTLPPPQKFCFGGALEKDARKIRQCLAEFFISNKYCLIVHTSYEILVWCGERERVFEETDRVSYPYQQQQQLVDLQQTLDNY